MTPKEFNILDRYMLARAAKRMEQQAQRAVATYSDKEAVMASEKIDALTAHILDGGSYPLEYMGRYPLLCTQDQALAIRMYLGGADDPVLAHIADGAIGNMVLAVAQEHNIDVDRINAYTEYYLSALNSR